MTVQVNIYEAKTNLSKLLEQVQAGERVVIAKAGKPIADIVRHQGTTVQFGSLAHLIHRFDEDEFNAADDEIRAMYDADFGLDA